MPLEVLKGDVRVEHRIAIVEAAHEPDRHESVGHGVDEPAAEFVPAKRVPHRVDHRTRRDAVGRHLPEFLDANRVQLRRPPGIEREPAHECLREIAANAVGQDRHLRTDVDPGLEGGLLLAVLPDPAVARSHPGDTIAVIENLGRRKAGEDVNALSFDQPAKPFDEPVERNDVVAVILERRRSDWKLDLARAGEKVDVIVMDFSREWGAALLEVRHELPERRRIEDRARQHVGPDLARLLQHRNRERFAAALLLQLRQPERSRHPRRTAADDEDVYVEGIATHQPRSSVQLPSYQSPVLQLDNCSNWKLVTGDGGYLFNSATIAGTISNRSPVMPKSAISKIGASGSLLIATIVREPFIPTRCWMAPEIPSATYSFGATV